MEYWFPDRARGSSRLAFDLIVIAKEIDGEPSLYITLDKDGAIKRIGDGTEHPESRDMFIGMTSADAFSEFARAVPDHVFQHMGAYDIEEKKGRAVTLHFFFGQRTRNRMVGYEFFYGTESGGVPPEIERLVRLAVELTDDWYRRALSRADADHQLSDADFAAMGIGPQRLSAEKLISQTTDGASPTTLTEALADIENLSDDLTIYIENDKPWRPSSHVILGPEPATHGANPYPGYEYFLDVPIARNLLKDLGVSSLEGHNRILVLRVILHARTAR